MSKFSKIFEGKFDTLMIALSLAPLVTVNPIYIVSINGHTFDLNVVFFIYFFLQITIRYNTRKLHGIYLVCDLIALISFIPTFSVFRLLLLTRLLSAAFRVRGMQVLYSIVKENSYIFKSILGVAVVYMIITSIIVFNVEPETFNNQYLYAFYWSGITLTTVGYGDVYPITPLGQVIALISSFLGIGIIALPTGIISSNFITRIEARERRKKSSKSQN